MVILVTSSNMPIILVNTTITLIVIIMVILATSINMPIIRLLDSKLASLIAFALACKIVTLMMREIILVMILYV